MTSSSQSKDRPLTASDATKRPHSTLHDSDDEDDTTDVPPELVSTFDHAAGGAISVGGVKEQTAPLVIKSQKNRDWRAESRRKRGLDPPGPPVKAQDTTDIVNGAPNAYGLTFVDKQPSTASPSLEPTQTPTSNGVQSSTPSHPRTDDELALEALTADPSTRKSHLVLPGPQGSTPSFNNQPTSSTPLNETDLFKADVSSRPDSASFDDYAAVPVEEFGAALLRGMGWKEGDTIGKRREAAGASNKPRLLERRPALLGIGAKEEAAAGIADLGAWGKGAKQGPPNKAKGGAKREVAKVYNPVVLRNARTGEMLSEEELGRKVEEGKKAAAAPINGSAKEEDDWRERRERNLKKDGRLRDRDEDRHHHRRHRRDDEDDRGSSRRRSRSTDSHHRRRPRDEDPDDRERERRRRRRDGRDDGGGGGDEEEYRERKERERRRRDQGWERDTGREERRRHDADRDRDRDREKGGSRRGEGR
ncbi:MAG: hypothetical protein M1833_007205 [Piccolia ochrophora]|nr:MAG: hypothetical protein M1833_007205 [Piccolia ochrophora]